MELKSKYRLFRAVEIGDQREFDKLVSVGVDINARDDVGNTPLHLAAHNCQDALVSQLIGLGADIDARNDSGATPIEEAAWLGDEATVRLLVNAGACRTPDEAQLALRMCFFERGACERDVAKGRILIEVGAALGLVEAIYMCDTEMVDSLIRKGAPIDEEDQLSGKPPLHHAVINDCIKLTDMVWFLLEKGADINVLDRDRCTALMLACEWCSAPIVEMLLKRGCDIRPVNIRGEDANAIHSRSCGSDLPVRTFPQR